MFCECLHLQNNNAREQFMKLNGLVLNNAHFPTKAKFAVCPIIPTRLLSCMCKRTLEIFLISSQSCGNICGAAVIVGVSLFVFNTPVFRSLCKSEEDCKVLYWSKVSDYGNLLRLIISKWLSDYYRHVGHLDFLKIYDSILTSYTIRK